MINIEFTFAQKKLQNQYSRYSCSRSPEKNATGEKIIASILNLSRTWELQVNEQKSFSDVKRMHLHFAKFPELWAKRRSIHT